MAANSNPPPPAGDGGGSALLVPLKPLPSELLPDVGTSHQLRAEHLEVLCAIYNMYKSFHMYCADSEAQQQAALDRYYAPDAVFQDNFLQASGRDQISALFYALRRCCHHLDLTLDKVDLLEAEQQHCQLRLLGRHSFYLPHTIRGPVTALLLPACLEVWTTDVLTIRAADQRVVHHSQRVHNMPVVSWLVRWAAGMMMCLFLVHVLGW